MPVTGFLAPLLTVEERQFAMQQPDGFCIEGGVCMQSDPFNAFFFAVVSTAVLALLLGVTLGYLREARAACKEERKRTRAEHDAFATFAERIANVQPSVVAKTAAAAPAGRPAQRFQKGPPNDQLETIREAYRETVMAVPHYEEDYDEPLAENVRAEFGEEIAAALTQGEQYTPQLQQALLQATEDARHRRAEFLTALDREVEAIDGARRELSDLHAELDAVDPPDRGFEELRDAWDRLQDLEARCERFLRERQETVQSSRTNGLRGSAFHEYVYQALPVRYPVLAEGTHLADRIKTARRRVLTKLTRSG